MPHLYCPANVQVRCLSMCSPPGGLPVLDTIVSVLEGLHPILHPAGLTLCRGQPTLSPSFKPGMQAATQAATQAANLDPCCLSDHPPPPDCIVCSIPREHNSLYQHRQDINLMMTSSNGNIFRIIAHLCGEFTGHGEFHAQRPVTQSFDFFLWSAPEWINDWVNNWEAGDLRRHRAHYNVIVVFVQDCQPYWGIYWEHCGVAYGEFTVYHNKRVLVFNSLWPCDTKWQHRSGSTLAQVMACCLTAPSHYLNQCWLIISKVEWRSSKGKFTRDTSAINHWNYLESLVPKISFKFPRGQWLKGRARPMEKQELQ